MRRRTPAALAVPARVGLALLAALPLLAACGDTNRAEANPDTAKPVELASVEATVYPAKTSAPASPTAAASGTAAPATSAPAAEPGTVTATLANTFTPAELKVKVGEKVTWKSEGGFHTVTGGDGSEDPSSPIGSKTMGDASATHEVTFTKAGTYPYFCQPHVSLGMKGTVVVA